MTSTLEIMETPVDVFSQMFSEEDLLRINKERQESLVACTTAAFYQFREMISPLVSNLHLFDVCGDAHISDVLKSDVARSAQETQVVFSIKREARCALTFPTNRRIEPHLLMSHSLEIFTDARLHLSTLLLVRVGTTPEAIYASGPCGYSALAELPEIECMLQDASLAMTSSFPAALTALMSATGNAVLTLP
jgi:hypothetical protein